MGFWDLVKPELRWGEGREGIREGEREREKEREREIEFLCLVSYLIVC